MARRGKGSKGGGVYVESVDVDIDRNAVDKLARLADPYILDCAEIIGESIVAQVPVADGIMQRSYNPTAREAEPGEVHLFPGSPFWHWLEYGTATSSVYRPVQRGVEATGVRYEAS